jgi:tetratricopeptide (TPR) repeat protein
MHFPLVKKAVCWVAAAALIAVGSMAWANAPQASNMSRIQTLTHDLHLAMNDLVNHSRTAAQGSYTGNVRYRDVAIRRFELLSNRLNAFNGTIAAAMTDPNRSVQDFNRLLSAYLGALQFASWMRDPQIMADLHRVQPLMDELVGYYGGYPEYGSADYSKLMETDTDLRNLTVIVVPAQTTTTTTTTETMGTGVVGTGWRIETNNTGYDRVRELSALQMNTLQALAKDLEKQSDKAMKEARVHSEDANYLRWEAVALRHMNRFEEAAEDFEKAVRKAPAGDLSETKDEFEKLLGAWMGATESFRWLFTRRDVEDEFLALSNTMDTIVSFYGGYPDPGTDAYRDLARSVDMDATGPDVKHEIKKEGGRE